MTNWRQKSNSSWAGAYPVSAQKQTALQASQLAAVAGDASGLALYLLKADPLLILRDLLGHSNVVTTEVYLKRLDLRRNYRAAWERTRGVIAAAVFAEDVAEFAEEL